jgi:membrane-bound lytic murein transglycosylase D
MIRTGCQSARAAIALGVVFAAACSARHQTHPVVVEPQPAARAVASTVPDAVSPPVEDADGAVLAAAQRHFEAGQKELDLRHLDRAKAEFDLALTVLLELPAGARSAPRTREAFDRMVDQISAYEMTALAEGDGFTERTYQSASIDELLSISTFEGVAPSADLRAAVAADLARTTHDIPIPLNDQVLTYIDLFHGRLHDWFQDALTRGGRYLPMIQGTLRAEGLPLDLAYVPLVESAFNPNALSRAKAKGTWQFVGGTAAQYGLKQDWYIDERSNPEKSTVAAINYLRALHRQFDGDWHLALASYNGGPGLVQRAMTRTRLSDFWMLIEKPRVLPRETRQYVPMVLAAMVIAGNPSLYGFEIEPEQPVEHDTVTLSTPVDLRRIAEWVGTSVEEIQALNPELRRWTTPVRYPDYQLAVPMGAAATVEARLAESVPEEVATLNWYAVKRGDTLTSIAKKLHVKRADLAEANYLSIRATVKPGQQLIIPLAPTGLLLARADLPVPTASSAAQAPRNAHAGGTAPDGAERIKVVYLVKSGDTLWSIARTFGTTVASLQTWNRLRSSRIYIGDRLTIYTSSGDRPVF